MKDTNPPKSGVSRRFFLGTAGTGAITAATGAGGEAAKPKPEEIAGLVPTYYATTLAP